MNPTTNRMEPMSDGLKSQLDELYHGKAERPVFRLGEVIEVRGYRWRVSKITRKGFALKGVGPAV